VGELTRLLIVEKSQREALAAMVVAWQLRLEQRLDHMNPEYAHPIMVGSDKSTDKGEVEDPPPLDVSAKLIRLQIADTNLEQQLTRLHKKVSALTDIADVGSRASSHSLPPRSSEMIEGTLANIAEQNGEDRVVSSVEQWIGKTLLSNEANTDKVVDTWVNKKLHALNSKMALAHSLLAERGVRFEDTDHWAEAELDARLRALDFDDAKQRHRTGRISKCRLPMKGASMSDAQERANCRHDGGGGRQAEAVRRSSTRSPTSSVSSNRTEYAL